MLLIMGSLLLFIAHCCMSPYKCSRKHVHKMQNIPIYISASFLNDIQGKNNFNSTENTDKWSADWYESAVTEDWSTSGCSGSMADYHG